MADQDSNKVYVTADITDTVVRARVPVRNETACAARGVSGQKDCGTISAVNGRIFILPAAVVALALAVEHLRGTSYDLAKNLMRLAVGWGLLVLVLAVASLAWVIGLAR